jgi:hypothetical protein
MISYHQEQDMPKSKRSQILIPSARSEDQPATRKMLSLVRDEILQKTEAGFNDLRAEIQRIEAGNSGMRADLQKLEAGSSGLRADIQKLEAGSSGLRADIRRLEAGNSRMLLLLEEQNANNRIVLEGLQALWQRQDRIEQRLS